MGALTAWLMATPLFGLSLTPPDATLPLDPTVLLVAEADVPPAAAPNGKKAKGNKTGQPDTEVPPPSDADLQAEQYARDMQRRAELIKLHRPFGIATWAAMTVTMILGGIQYHNQYGFFAGQDDNPCVKGEAIGGQSACSGTPWPHLAAATVTTALYATTFTLSLAMPDPGGLDKGDSAYAKRLRTHKTLRWIHLGGMIAQLALGIVIANGEWFGLDRANDYTTLQALSTAHLALGFVTYGALTWAGALYAF